MGISKLFYRDTHISLMKRGERFALSIRYADQPCSLEEGLKRWPEIEPIKPYFHAISAQETEVPIGRLSTLIETMTALGSKHARSKKLIFYVQPEVGRARVQNAAPTEFCFRYVWENGALRRMMPEGVVELPDGWYRQGDVYWSYPSLSGMDQQRIRRKNIERQEILEFLQRDLTAYAAAGVRYTCELHHDTIPVLELAIDLVDDYEVQVHRKWNAPPEHIDAAFDLDGYVVAGRTLRPGIRPSVLSEHLRFESDVATLRNMEIARFLDGSYQKLKPWFIRGAHEFEEAHVFVKPPYEWLLVASADPVRGIGQSTAYPLALIGGDEFSVGALTQLMRAPYARIAAGWLRRPDLLMLGIDAEGKWSGKGSFQSMSLTPAQIVCRGDARLIGPWNRMEMRGAPWCASATKQRAAREHLSYLIHWGISGGIVGGYEAAAVYGVELLGGLFAVDAKVRILVVADKADADEFMTLSGGYRAFAIQQYEADRENAVYCVSFDKLGKAPAAREISWDLVLVIEPDLLYTPGKKVALAEINALNARCRLGFYAGGSSGWDADMLRVQKAVLGLDVPDFVMRLLLQNPRGMVPPPPPFVFTASAPTPASDSGFTVELSGEVPTGFPVPPREQTDRTAMPTVTAPLPTRPVLLTGNSSNEGFIREARKLAGLGGASEAPHVPFAVYWPKYSDMSVAQRNWYFHLRGKMHRGEYPETDLSYLFVRVYELINLIACENANDAYRELLGIWTHYRERYPRLDKYLDDWMFDLICVRETGVGAWEHMQNAPAIPLVALDLALTKRDIHEPLLLPIPALEAIGDYRARQSKFYLSGYADLMEKALPRAVAYVDACLRERESGGLLREFESDPITASREAFQSAIVEQSLTYTIAYIPFSENASFRERVSQMLRYAENALRIRFGFGAKLRGITLDKAYADLIDAYMDRQFARKVEPSKPSRVVLDAKAIERLRDESDEVRDALIASMQQEEVLIADDIETPVRPEDAPEGLLTDLGPVNRILHALTKDQRLILEYFRTNGWEQEAEVCAQAFPMMLMDVELDAINAQALTFLGNRLVAQEGAVIAVADDYRDELAYLIQHPEERQTGEWTVEPEGLEPEWVDFFRAADLEALGAVLAGDGALSRLASDRGDLLDLIVDALNAAAMDTVGDLIVEGDTLIDEYEPLIAAHLRKV